MVVSMTAEQLEKCRRCAIALLHAGAPYRVIARQVDAAVSSVVRWQQAYAQDRAVEGCHVEQRPQEGLKG